ncbi:MAG TPA: trigger factor [Planctomycetes bacterium]|nr:trigger factor [Planctomycetaceae bacterium]HIM30537.1 trigger factor [Planctomycetota bacterium]
MASDTTNDDAVDQDEKAKLSLEIQVEEPSACQRHVTVTVAREDVDRYLDEAYDELLPKAEVPGFRPGRAPRKLVEGRFRDQVHDQVKGSLLLDSMTQVNEEKDFSAISEPDFKFDAIDIPDEGPLTFEFDLEVRPDFKMPEYKGLKLERPTKELNDADVEKRIEDYQNRQGSLEKVDEPAKAGDYVWVDLKFSHEDTVLAEYAEEVVRIVETLSFEDAELTGFEKLMVGASAGDDRSAKVTVSEDSPKESLRGVEVTTDIHVREVKRLSPLELTDEVLQGMGIDGQDKLREVIRGELENQIGYQQRQRLREQITGLLTESADWELPPDMLRRQAGRELDRAVMELQSSGFGEADINVHLNRLRQNTLASTEKALKEHFILERIAEEHKLEAADEDYDREIMMIAMSNNENPRRVRARMEKQGQLDTLRNQIIERKVIDLIQGEAEFTDVPLDEDGPSSDNVMALKVPVAGALKEEIPEANTADTAEPADRS